MTETLFRLQTLFTPTLDSINKLIVDFQTEIKEALVGNTSSVAMHPSYASRSTGREIGEFISLDLGGSQVRATVVKLSGNGNVSVKRQDTFRIKRLDGEATDLFDPVARFIGDMLEENRSYKLGFIFAFPIEQISVNTGKLTKWTKEFSFRNVEGCDVTVLLQRSIDRLAATKHSLQNVTVSALANDAVGVLATGAYLDARCDMGLIVATGTNMAVALDRSLSGTLLTPIVGESGEMIFNMESGNFAGVRLIQTVYDRLLDAGSGTQGQLLEKMVSGRYLGEIVRLIVIDISCKTDTFSDWTNNGSAFGFHYAFTTENLSDIVHDNTRELVATGMLLKGLGVRVSTLEDRRVMKEICGLVGARSAQLVAMCISATTKHVDPALESEHVIAVDGGLFRGYPDYNEMVQVGLRNMLGESASKRVQISFVRESTALGAAIIAATIETNLMSKP